MMLSKTKMTSSLITAMAMAMTTVAATPLLAETHEITPGDAAATDLQEALILADPGDVVLIRAGVYQLSDGLSLDVDGVTIRGEGPDQSILSFAEQKGAGEGLLVTADNVVLRDFAIEDSKGDGIKSKQADNIVYHNVRVEWTGGPKPSNGAYGIYPVESENILINEVEVIGASDAGIYVGQSRNIIVRGSIARFNVAGIEIENSFDADVYGNLATRNTGGILVFDLPDLPQQGGHNVRLFDNIIINNDTPNFAPPGNIVASVPSGTGVMIMANHHVEIFDNYLDRNATANVLVIGYPLEHQDENYQPLPSQIHITGNRHGTAGYRPGFAGGMMLASAFGGELPPIIWDGLNAPDALMVGDDVAILNLGLSRQAQPMTEANPSIAAKSDAVALSLPMIKLPEAMYQAIAQ